MAAGGAGDCRMRPRQVAPHDGVPAAGDVELAVDGLQVLLDRVDGDGHSAAVSALLSSVGR